jgi:Iron-containing redox enzyme
MKTIHDLNQRSESGRGVGPARSFTQYFDDARLSVAESLPDPASLSLDQCRLAIRRYSAAVIPNFVKWLAAAAVSARSQDARYAASENAYVEIQEDHPGMLRALARSSGASPEALDYEFVEEFVVPIQLEVARMNGLFLIALNGCIEHTSLAFVPWIGRVAHRLGNENFKYVEVHGEADIGHAEQFEWALEKEAALHSSPDSEIALACNLTVSFVKGVLIG